MNLQESNLDQVITTSPELYAPEKQKNAKPIIGYLSFSPRGFQRIHCLDVDGVAVYGGDIVLGSTKHMAEIEALCQEVGLTHFRCVSLDKLHPTIESNIDTSDPWTNRTVYYLIDDSLTDQTNLIQALQAWQDTGLYNMVECTDQQPNYVRVINDGTTSIYSEYVGMHGGEQIINLADGYSVGNAIHEFGHAIGLNHEQKRYDTESYLQINWENINDDSNTLYQYEPNVDGTVIGHYDYYSIMEYPAYGNGKDSSIPTLIPYDSNAVIGQRNALTVFDLNGAQSMYLENSISSITVELKTGSNSTNGNVYLGIGGREFSLDTSGNDRRSNSTDTYILGETPGGLVSNVKSSSQNDPRTPSLYVKEILSLPTYIRLDSTDGWDLKSVTVTIQGMSPIDFPDFHFYYRAGAITLDTTGTQSVQLLRAPASGLPYLQENLKVFFITAEISTGSNATNDDVYLGIGGREFNLDTSGNNFKSNHTETFTLGHNHNVNNNTENDPRTPQLIISDINSYPAYLRKNGTDDWDLSEATITVTYKDSYGGYFYTVSFELAAGGITLTEDAGLYTALKYASRTVNSVKISKVVATIATGNNSSTDDVYLGVGGREFKLDTGSNDDFSANDSTDFIFGEGANILNSSLNDPSQQTLLDTLTFGAYIRKTGTDGLSISQTSVTVYFEEENRLPIVFNSYFDYLELDDECGLRMDLVKQ